MVLRNVTLCYLAIESTEEDVFSPSELKAQRGSSTFYFVRVIIPNSWWKAPLRWNQFLDVAAFGVRNPELGKLGRSYIYWYLSVVSRKKLSKLSNSFFDVCSQDAVFSDNFVSVGGFPLEAC